MNQIAKRILENTGLCTVLALTALMLLGPGMAGAQIQFLDDGAIPNAAGGWDLPAQGTCPVDLTQTTRPDCVALRLNVLQANCTTRQLHVLDDQRRLQRPDQHHSGRSANSPSTASGTPAPASARSS